MGYSAHSRKKNGENRPGVRLRVPKRLFFCFLSPIQCGLSATYLPAPISTIFETKDVNRCPRAYTGEKFRNFCGGVFHVPKNSWNGYCQWWGVCAWGAAQTAQFLTMGIISGASRHPKDVPFVREFCWKTYGFGTISPQ